MSNSRYCYSCNDLSDATVMLSPPTNAFVPVCLGGSASIMCSTTEGPLLWISDSGNRLFNSLQAPVMLENLTLSVESAVVTGNTISVHSTATINDFQTSLNNSLVMCRETSTGITKQATFVTAGKLVLSVSRNDACAVCIIYYRLIQCVVSSPDPALAVAREGLVTKIDIIGPETLLLKDLACTSQ